MKIIIIFIMLIGIVNGANIEVKQNIRALYKGVELTEIQEDYILDNQDKNINIFKKILKEEIRYLRLKYINEKNIVKFSISPSGKISNIKMLQKSHSRKIDRATKRAINKTIFTKPKEKTELRYIITYRAGQTQNTDNYSNMQPADTKRKTYYEKIFNGTTRFEHSSKEYVRVF